MTVADQHAFSTYADTVASALQDATTSRHLRTMTARTAFEAVHDPLTALFNRSTLVALGNAHLSEAAPGPVVALILLDLDDFREVNDTLGLTAGDHLLRTLGRRLLDEGRSGEIIGRAGGDEFAVLLTDPTARGTAELDGRSASSRAGLEWALGQLSRRRHPGLDPPGRPGPRPAGAARPTGRGAARGEHRGRGVGRGRGRGGRRQRHVDCCAGPSSRSTRPSANPPGSTGTTRCRATTRPTG